MTFDKRRRVGGSVGDRRERVEAEAVFAAVGAGYLPEVNGVNRAAQALTVRRAVVVLAPSAARRRAADRSIGSRVNIIFRIVRAPVVGRRGQLPTGAGIARAFVNFHSHLRQLFIFPLVRRVDGALGRVFQPGGAKVHLERGLLFEEREERDAPRRAPAPIARSRARRVAHHRARRENAVNIGVIRRRQSELLHFVRAFHPSRRLASRLDGGQKKTDQNPDNRDDDKKLDERKTAAREQVRKRAQTLHRIFSAI